MANIPVGTKIPVTEYIPLPQPRPILDKLLEFTPFVPSQGLDLPTPVVGTAWLLSPFVYLGTKMNELVTAVSNVVASINIYDIPDYWVMVGLGISALVALSVFASLVVGSVYVTKYLIRKFW